MLKENVGDKNNIGKYTFRLFSRPSFAEGFSSIVDFRDNINKYNTDETDNLADARSLFCDWKAIGQDLTFAMRTYHGKEKEETATATTEAV